MELNVIVAGEAGQGAFSVERELTEALSKLGYHFFATKNYMSRVRGGHNFHMIRVADHPVHALDGGKWDLIVALDAETERVHKPDLRPGGIYLSLEMTRSVQEAARTHFQNAAASNAMLVAIILAVLGVDPGTLEAAAEPGKGEQWKRGFEIAAGWNLSGAHPVAAAAGARRKFDGNQALAIGAILGGCQFMAGYPMTPATSIMQYFSEASQGLPIHFEQAEDEIAAVNMALGASYAGVRALVATSGGGFALMQEGVSLAGMTETPIVIAVAQRPGPATGLPTRTEQGDLDFVLHAGHGEFPRVIYAPGDIGEALSLARRSFALADRFQLPVFILTDQYFADSIQVFEDELPLAVDRREVRDFDASYARYRLTEDGLSALAFPGCSGAVVRVDSDEHDEQGRITEDPALRVRMVDKRRKKAALLAREAIPPTWFGDGDAQTVLLCWGSTKLIVKEAAERLADGGIPAAVCHFGQVWPLTGAMVARHRLEGRKLVCIENNAGGQFAALLESALGLAADHRVLKYDGNCFTVEELVQRLKGLLTPEAKND